MLDGLLGRGFTSKCKSQIKATRARIEVVRRRAEARQRFLKEDLAKLLSNGLDINAYGRTEEFLMGLNLLACYDFIEQTCEYITRQLLCMQKQRECPEECREAVGSLIFAAARFSDLPELRDLRDLFQERFGNSLDCFVHPKFIEKISTSPPERERRVQLLGDIASEYSIKWDSLGFDQRMNPPSGTQDQKTKHVSSHVNPNSTTERTNNGRVGTPFRSEGNTPKTHRHEKLNTSRAEVMNVHKVCDGREGGCCTRKESVIQLHANRGPEATSDSLEVISNREGSAPLGDKKGVFYSAKRDLTAEKYWSTKEKDGTCPEVVKSGSSPGGKKSESSVTQNSGLNNITNGESRDGLSSEISEIASSLKEIPRKSQNISIPDDHSSGRSGSKMQEHTDTLNSYQTRAPLPPYVRSKDIFHPPPYMKPRDNQHRKSKGSNKHADLDGDRPSMELSPGNKVNTVDYSDRIGREEQTGKHGRESFDPAALNYFGTDNIVHNQGHMISLPKPRSIRRKHHKSSTHQNEVGHSEDARMSRKSSSRRRDHARKGLQILFDHDQKDEEETTIDKLLLHYSKKGTDYDTGQARKKSYPLQSRTTDRGESSHVQNRDLHVGESEYFSPPTRSISLPHEQTATPEDIRVFTRANSFQPDNQARHVHPKLPDYDDLAARLAELRTDKH